jgi:hypothetical protein
MEKTFKVDITCHNQYGIQLWDNGQVENFKSKKNFLKRAVLDNWIKSEFYQKKQKVSPFLQSNCNDFIMVEFWTDDLKAVEEYVEFLNSEYNNL